MQYLLQNNFLLKCTVHFKPLKVYIENTQCILRRLQCKCLVTRVTLEDLVWFTSRYNKWKTLVTTDELYKIMTWKTLTKVKQTGDQSDRATQQNKVAILGPTVRYKTLHGRITSWVPLEWPRLGGSDTFSLLTSLRARGSKEEEEKKEKSCDFNVTLGLRPSSLGPSRAWSQYKLDKNWKSYSEGLSIQDRMVQSNVLDENLQMSIGKYYIFIIMLFIFLISFFDVHFYWWWIWRILSRSQTLFQKYVELNYIQL